MVIDDALLDRLSGLGMISIQDCEREGVRKNLEEVLSFVDNISSIDTDFDLVESGRTPLRDDEVCCDEFIGKDILSNAPKSKDGYFIVPKIIE